MKLDAKNVSVSIAGKTIVRNLSIEVPDRKFSALLGANGSGKTTLLRSIYRTQKMDSGIVRLDDEDITHFSGKKLARNMAVMGQFNRAGHRPDGTVSVSLPAGAGKRAGL